MARKQKQSGVYFFYRRIEGKIISVEKTFSTQPERERFQDLYPDEWKRMRCGKRKFYHIARFNNYRRLKEFVEEMNWCNIEGRAYNEWNGVMPLEHSTEVQYTRADDPVSWTFVAKIECDISKRDIDNNRTWAKSTIEKCGGYYDGFEFEEPNCRC